MSEYKEYRSIAKGIDDFPGLVRDKGLPEVENVGMLFAFQPEVISNYPGKELRSKCNAKTFKV